MLLLHGVTLQVDRIDRWLWTLETSHVFSVRSAYNLLTFQSSTVSWVAVSSLWNKDIPLKVVLFAWRLFRDRLPTNDNLLRCGVIHNDVRLCVSGCGIEENLDHLFLHCNSFGSIWFYIYRWMGMSTVIPFSIGDHFNQFTSDGGVTKARRSILQVLWYATTWEI